MTIPSPAKSWPGRITPVTLHAAQGGVPLVAGGQNALPFAAEGDAPHRTAVGMEVAVELPGMSAGPAGYAKRCVAEWGAQFLFITLAACHPDGGGMPADRGAELVGEILSAVSCPAIVGGCCDEEVDARLFPAVAEAAPRPVFLSYADEKNYRLVGGAAMAYGHGVVAWSPIDVNMAKQVNLLLADIGVPRDRILIDPLTGGLGYGLEYTFSIVERIRLAGLSGDGMLALPVICHLGDCWKAREAVDASETSWGDVSVRARRWEESAGWACIAAGADLLVCRHPANVAMFGRIAWR